MSREMRVPLSPSPRMRSKPISLGGKVAIHRHRAGPILLYPSLTLLARVCSTLPTSAEVQNPCQGDQGSAIAVDASGSAYVTGFTFAQGYFHDECGFDGFMAKLNPEGSALVYSTQLGAGEQGLGIAVDALGCAYITGIPGGFDPTIPGRFEPTPGAYYGPWRGGFVTKLDPSGSAPVYSTSSIGGSAITLDAYGNAYVTGHADSSNFPTTSDAFQTASADAPHAFLTKLNAAGSALLYSTLLGGNNGKEGDAGNAISLDSSGNAYVTGWTASSNFPTTPGALQTTYGGGDRDVFVAKISFAAVPLVVLTPSSLSFARQAMGTTSVALKVRVSNSGSKALSITSIVASGDFAQTNDCPATVPPAGSCTLSVTFTPTATGTRTGAITVTDNAVGSPHKLSLTGTGGVPLAILTSTSLTFASQAVGTTSPAQPTTLKNTGSGPLSITGIAVSGDFGQTNNCGSKVNPGASCTLNVTFKPTATGTRTGTISITTTPQAARTGFCSPAVEPSARERSV